MTSPLFSFDCTPRFALKPVAEHCPRVGAITFDPEHIGENDFIVFYQSGYTLRAYPLSHHQHANGKPYWLSMAEDDERPYAFRSIEHLVRQYRSYEAQRFQLWEGKDWALEMERRWEDDSHWAEMGPFNLETGV